MKIDFPEHEIGAWEYTPWWMVWRPYMRRWRPRWVLDHRGCACTYYWQYKSRWRD